MIGRSQKSHKIEERKKDREFQEAVCAGGKCAKCGSRWQLSGHHIIPRRFRATRWDLENAVCLCFTHHRWAHDKPIEFKEWLASTP